MTNALTLFDVVDLPHTATPRERFEAFHARNPHVYQRLVAMTRALRDRGHTRVGMKMLFEVLRHDYMLTTDDPDSDFKLNNSMTAFYSRLVMDLNPDLDGIYETRKQRCET